MNVKGILLAGLNRDNRFFCAFRADEERSIRPHIKVGNGSIEILHPSIFLLFLQP